MTNGADFTQSESSRKDHPDYVPTQAVRVRTLLETGVLIIGDLHVAYPGGRVSDVVNDDRRFLPFTNVVVEGDSTQYDFLTVAKERIVMIYEINR